MKKVRMQPPKGFGAPQSRIDMWRESMAKQIKQKGRGIVSVLRPEHSNPKNRPQGIVWFSYTLGNCMSHHPIPELWSWYPSAPSMEYFLNQISDMIRDGKITNITEKPQIITGFAYENDDLPAMIRLCSAEERESMWSEFTCQLPSSETPVAVIDFPDPDGNWPWEADCTPCVAESWEEAPVKAKN